MLPNIIILSVIFFAIAILVIFKNNLHGTAYKYLLFYLCTNFIFEAIAFYLTERSNTNMGVYNLEMVFEVSFFLILIKKESSGIRYKKIITVFAFLFVAFAILNMIFFQSISIFNSNTYTLGTFLLVFACGIFLYNSILKNEEKNPLFSFMFWISLGVLFCYLVNLPFLTNVNNLFNISEALTLRLRIISVSVNVLLYLLITVGIICNRKI